MSHDPEYLEVTGVVVHFTEKAVLLRVGNHHRQEWFPMSTLAYEPSFTKGETVTLDVSERFLSRACPWLLRADWEDYCG